jgi:hypothetical protein
MDKMNGNDTMSTMVSDMDNLSVKTLETTASLLARAPNPPAHDPAREEKKVSKLEKTKKKCRKLLKEKFKVGKPESQ